ncbi:MAG: taurine dioxygenase [Actinobacteria bacterium]|jgi:taurine dioxygenase|nr:taurine dioxygenase [Actinomycetota bacterium]
MTAADPKTKDPIARIAPRRVHIEKFGVELGPVVHVADERARLSSPQYEHITVTPKGVTLGAEISGVRLSGDLPDQVIAEIRRAWLDYKVVYVRDQDISSTEHVEFARRFGELEVHPFLLGSEEHPELVRFEKGVEASGFENGWHHDVTWRENPSMGAILRSIQVPATGGDTAFSDMAAAYDGLDDEMKERLDGLQAAHDYTLAFGSFVDDSKKAQMREQYPVVHHPIVRTHPETGRKLLFVNAYFTSHVVDMDENEGNQLLRYLISRASIMEYQYRVVWEPNQVTLWDNRIVQHYALSDYYPDVRIMERASIVGDRPV